MSVADSAGRSGGSSASTPISQSDPSVASARAREPCKTASRSAAAVGSIDSLSRSSAEVTVTSVRLAATAGYATRDHGADRSVVPAFGAEPASNPRR